MTHKNPELRAGSVVKAKESSPKPKTTPSYGKAVGVYIGVEAFCHFLFLCSGGRRQAEQI